MKNEKGGFYNHYCDLNLAVVTGEENGKRIRIVEYLDALEDRLGYLRAHPEEVLGSFSLSGDCYREDPAAPTAALAAFLKRQEREAPEGRSRPAFDEEERVVLREFLKVPEAR
jgi:hypothetical protein